MHSRLALIGMGLVLLGTITGLLVDGVLLAVTTLDQGRPDPIGDSASGGKGASTDWIPPTGWIAVRCPDDLPGLWPLPAGIVWETDTEYKPETLGTWGVLADIMKGECKAIPITPVKGKPNG